MKTPKQLHEEALLANMKKFNLTYEQAVQQAIDLGFQSKIFKLGEHEFQAQDCVNGVLIDPVVPVGFWVTPVDERTIEELAQWQGLPFIVSSANGIYKVYCLTIGAWDRPSLLYAGDNLGELIAMVARRYD
jgi:hypothetical protein